MSTKTFEVGQTFEVVREIDRFRPIYYAAAAGDFNPIHIDKELGEAAGLGGNILHGLCTLSIASDAAARFFGGPTRLAGIRVRFSKPVKPDDTITFRGKVVEVGAGRVKAELSAVNQAGEEVLKNGFVEGFLDGTGA